MKQMWYCRPTRNQVSNSTCRVLVVATAAAAAANLAADNDAVVSVSDAACFSVTSRFITIIITITTSVNAPAFDDATAAAATTTTITPYSSRIEPNAY